MEANYVQNNNSGQGLFPQLTPINNHQVQTPYIFTYSNNPQLTPLQQQLQINQTSLKYPHNLNAQQNPHQIERFTTSGVNGGQLHNYQPQLQMSSNNPKVQLTNNTPKSLKSQSQRMNQGMNKLQQQSLSYQPTLKSLIHQNPNLATHQDQTQTEQEQKQSQLDKKRREEKNKEEIILEEFSGTHISDLLQMMSKDEDEVIKEEFMYPYKAEQMDEEYLRSMFSSYRLRNDKYAALRISIQTSYGWKTLIGTAHVLQQNATEKKGLLAKFYISRIYRRSGYEEKCLLEIMKFAFEVMGLEKMIVFVNEQNQYFCKLLMWMHFRLIKMKPKAHGGLYNRLMLSMLKDDFQELMSKHYNKIIKNKFYNSFMHDNYRENNMINNILQSQQQNPYGLLGSGVGAAGRRNMSNQNSNAVLPLTNGSGQGVSISQGHILSISSGSGSVLNNDENNKAPKFKHNYKSPNSEKYNTKPEKRILSIMDAPSILPYNRVDEMIKNNNQVYGNNKRGRSSESVPTSASNKTFSANKNQANLNQNPIPEQIERSPIFPTPIIAKQQNIQQQSQSQFLNKMKKQVSLPKLNIISQNGQSNLQTTNNQDRLIGLLSPGSPVSKQSILDDIKRLDTEIEQEQRSFYTFKNIPDNTTLQGNHPLERKSSNQNFANQASKLQPINQKSGQQQQQQLNSFQQQQNQQQILKIPPINQRAQESNISQNIKPILNEQTGAFNNYNNQNNNSSNNPNLKSSGHQSTISGESGNGGKTGKNSQISQIAANIQKLAPTVQGSQGGVYLQQNFINMMQYQ